jgi:tetratricopeptide (TPR) repeat protein
MRGPRHGRVRTLLVAGLGPACVALALVGLVEATLRLAGWRIPVPAGGDPWVNLTPFFERTTRADGVVVMRRRDGEIEFLAEKAANGFRVFVLGESSVHGFPYLPGFSFAAFLEARLALALPGHVVEVVNCGVDGIGSWHVRRIANEIVGYQADAVVLYAGHNEYVTPEVHRVGRTMQLLAGLRFYQLAVRAGAAWRRWWVGPIDEASLASSNQPYGAARRRALGRETLSDGDRARVVARYAANVEAIVERVQEMGAVPLVASLAQDLRDWPPGAWRHTPGLSPEDVARWTRYAEDGDAQRRAGNCQAALEAFRAAARIDRRPAALHYARARCFEALGRWTAARRAYRRASDLDEVPLGAPSVLNVVLRGVARRYDAPFVDVERVFLHAAEHGLVGRRWFVDPMHPTLRGHQLIAAVLAARLQRLGLPVAGAHWAASRYQDLDPEDILLARPRFRRREYESRILLFLLLEQRDHALREVSDGASQFPELHAVATHITGRLDSTTNPLWINSFWR